MQNEEEWIRRASGGDEAAFEQLLLAYEKPVYNLCLRMAGSADDAWDLSQEVFIKVWRGLPEYRFASGFSTWLYRLASNTCIDYLRRKKRRNTVSLTLSDEQEQPQELELLDPAPLPQEQLEQKERQAAVEQALAQLPDDFRQILQLRVGQELSYEQIAQILDIRVGTVKSRLARARMQLREILENGNFFEKTSSNPVKKEAVHREL